MAKGILGRKLGMTQIFTQDGKMLPITVVEAGPCVVAQVKTVETDGYNAVQMGFGAIKDKHVNKPEKGHFAKAGVSPVRYVREFRLPGTPDYTLGQEVKADVFTEGELVDVTGISRGKGFAGAIKRHGFSRGPRSHGSKSYREPGSIGSRMSGGGGKVFKGKKLPGRMGGAKVTVQRLQIVRADADRNLILIKGAIPGPKGALVVIRNTVKPVK